MLLSSEPEDRDLAPDVLAAEGTGLHLIGAVSTETQVPTGLKQSVGGLAEAHLEPRAQPCNKPLILTCWRPCLTDIYDHICWTDASCSQKQQRI